MVTWTLNRIMKKNPVKEKLRRGEPSFGTWLSFANLLAARALARSGFDWLTLDIEHQGIDWELATTLMASIADAGCVPLVRVPEGDYTTIKRALDCGAFGIVVPMVDTVEQAKTVVNAAKYPPEGNRSLGGAQAQLNFDAPPAEYFDKVNDEILVILQTESPTGVRNAEEIYAVDGVDGIFIGPVDLRARVHADGHKPTSEEFEALLQAVVDAGKKTGTPTGMHTMSAADALMRAKQGMQFIAVGSDMRLMLQQAREDIDELGTAGDRQEVAKY